MYKKNDWCFFEFQLCQVGAVEGQRITEIRTGYSSCSGYKLNESVQPLNLRNKAISEEFELYRTKFHAINGANLNYPDIHRYLVTLWMKACDLPLPPPDAEDDKALRAIYNELRDFYDEIVRKVELLKSEKVNGIRVLR